MELCSHFPLRMTGTTQCNQEKALSRSSALYPVHKTESALTDFRLDEDILHDDFDLTEWESLGARFNCMALEKRMRLFRKVYGL